MHAVFVDQFSVYIYIYRFIKHKNRKYRKYTKETRKGNQDLNTEAWNFQKGH